MQDERRGFGETSPRRLHTNGDNIPRANGNHRASGGHRESVRARPIPFREISDEPVDLVAVQADDELISALAAGMAVSAPGVGGYDADDQVVAMLAAWRAEVDAEPLPELVDLDTAAAAVLAASRPPSRRMRHLVPLAAAAATVVFSIGGVSIGAAEARPGDALWDVSKVLYSERAESVEAAVRVDDRIAEAKTALTQGESVVAAQLLAEAEQDLAVVRAEEGLAELTEVQSFLEAKAAETPPGQPIQPGTPLASDPTRPVPPRAGTSDPVASEPDPSSSATTGPSQSDTAPSAAPEPGPSGDGTPSEKPTSEPTTAPPAVPEGEENPPATSTPSGTAEGSADATAAPGGQSYGSSRSEGDAGSTSASSTPSASGTQTSESAPTS